MHNKLHSFDMTADLSSTRPWSKSSWSHTDLPRLKEGKVGAQVSLFYLLQGGKVGARVSSFYLLQVGKVGAQVSSFYLLKESKVRAQVSSYYLLQQCIIIGQDCQSQISRFSSWTIKSVLMISM